MVLVLWAFAASGLAIIAATAIHFVQRAWPGWRGGVEGVVWNFMVGMVRGNVGEVAERTAERTL